MMNGLSLSHLGSLAGSKASAKVKVRRHAAALAVGLAGGGSMELDQPPPIWPTGQGWRLAPRIDVPKDIQAELAITKSKALAGCTPLSAVWVACSPMTWAWVNTTITDVSLLAPERRPRVQLVVAPRSVVDNWYEEVLKFLPEIPCSFIQDWIDQEVRRPAERRCVAPRIIFCNVILNY